MNDAHVAEPVRPAVIEQARAMVAAAIAGWQIGEVHVFGGRLYAGVVQHLHRLGIFGVAPIAWDARGIGHKLGSLKAWLSTP